MPNSGRLPVAALANGDVVVARESGENTITLATLHAGSSVVTDEEVVLVQ